MNHKKNNVISNTNSIKEIEVIKKLFYVTFPENSPNKKYYLEFEATNTLQAQLYFHRYFGEGFGKIYSENKGKKIIEDNFLIKYNIKGIELKRYSFIDNSEKYFTLAVNQKFALIVFQKILCKTIDFYKIKEEK
jgi:hypothetical protein